MLYTTPTYPAGIFSRQITAHKIASAKTTARMIDPRKPLFFIIFSLHFFGNLFCDIFSGIPDMVKQRGTYIPHPDSRKDDENPKHDVHFPFLLILLNIESFSRNTGMSYTVYPLAFESTACSLHKRRK
jgi:hypothetical protein